MTMLKKPLNVIRRHMQKTKIQFYAWLSCIHTYIYNELYYPLPALGKSRRGKHRLRPKRLYLQWYHISFVEPC